MARKRSFRRARDEAPRNRPEAPRLLSAVPFLAVLALLGVLAVAIMIIAFPGNQPQPLPKAAPAQERGVAARGWFQEAEREMRRR